MSTNFTTTGGDRMEENKELEMLVKSVKDMGEVLEKVQQEVENIRKELHPKAPRVKIFKSVTQKSTIDAQASLDYHQEKKGEQVYKGKIVLSITEMDPETKKAVVDAKGNKKVLSGFLDKTTAKLIFSSIRENTFRDIFGDWGETIYGGSIKDGKVRARTIKVRPSIDKTNNTIKHYIFTIEEGEGVKEENGSIKLKGAADMKVVSYVPYKEALKLAIEIHDYIMQEEQAAFLRGNPLYTVMPAFEGFKKEGHVSDVIEPTQEVPTQEVSVGATEEAIYIISAKQWKGKTMADLSNEDLLEIIKKTKDSTNEKAKEMYEHAMAEAKKRRSQRAI